jgi:outer membrane protein
MTVYLMKGFRLMRASVLRVAIVLLFGVAGAAAQAPQPPATQPTPPTPPGAAPAPAPAPAQTPPAPAPFPAGEKYGYVNLQAVMGQSVDGKAAAAKLQAETKRKSAEAEAKMKAMQANQQKLQTSSALMSAEARSQLEKDIERQQREGERFEQDAQAELTEMQQKLQAEYNRKLFPVLEQLAKDIGVSMLFSAADSGLIWAKPGLDLTADAVKRMDALPPPQPLPPSLKPAAPTGAKPAPAPGAKP